MTTMSAIFKLNLGDEVKDKVSGATGVVTCRAQLLSGNIRVAVRPKEVKDGKPADSFWIDEDALVVTKPSEEKREERAFRFELGDKVKDKWSAHSGIVGSRQDHLYGCHRYEVQPRKVSKTTGKIHEAYSHDENALLLVSRATTNDARPTRKDGAEGLAAPASAIR